MSEPIIVITQSKLNRTLAFEHGEGANSAQQKGGDLTVWGDNSVAEGTSSRNAAEIQEISTASTDTELYTNWRYSGASEDDKFTLVKGESAHGEGHNALVLGNNSHAEGNGTVAGNNSAHAEGTGSEAWGKYSHAEGLETLAYGSRSHAEGQESIAHNNESHAEGHKTIAGMNTENIPDYNSAGTYSVGDQVIYNDILYTCVKNNPGSSHKPSGASTYWRREQGQHSEGEETSATTRASHAEGFKTLATGLAAHAEGSSTTASGSNAHAEGTNTAAIKGESHAEGNATTAGAWASHTEGYGTETAGDYTAKTATADNDGIAGQMAHAEGNSTTAIGNASHAEGRLTFATADNSHAEGVETTAGYNGTQLNNIAIYATGTTYGKGAVVKQNGTDKQQVYVSLKASNKNHPLTATTYWEKQEAVHAEGFNTHAYGLASHAEGRGTTVTGATSHAEGYNTTVYGGYGAHAEGDTTTASANTSHAEGEQTIGYGINSHVEGFKSQTGYSGNTVPSTNQLTTDTGTSAGRNAHAEGNATIAAGIASHSEGVGTLARNEAEHAGGKFNVSHRQNGSFGDGGNTIFSIGIGQTSGSPKNAIEIMQDGSIFVNGIGEYTGTSISGATKLQDVIKNAENDTFIINPGVTTWQETYDAYQAGKLVYYREALCKYFNVSDEEINEVNFGRLAEYGEYVSYDVGPGSQLSDVVPFNIPSTSFDINANEVIYEKQLAEILPNGVATRDEIDSLFDGGGGGGS